MKLKVSGGAALEKFQSHWIIFDKRNKHKTAYLALATVQEWVLNLSSEFHDRYYLWTPGWKDWRKLSVVLQDQSHPFQRPPAEPSHSRSHSKSSTGSIDERTGIFTRVKLDNSNSSARYEKMHEPVDFSGDELKLQDGKARKINLGKKSLVDRRTNQRHAMKIEVILLRKEGRAFRTYSKDISLGGTLLVDEIPLEFRKEQFDLIFVNHLETDPEKKKVTLKAKIVGDYAQPRRLNFVETSEGTFSGLKDMLHAYSQHRSDSTAA